MTIHKAKGLEWPIVFIPDLARDKKSDSSAILVDPEIGVAFQMEGDGYEKTEPAIHKLIKHRRKERDISEARRLYYVALTRARDKVILTATKEKGFAMDILKPGLDAAGITNEIIPYNEMEAIAPSPGEPEPFNKPQHVNVQPVSIGLRDLPVTALTTYSKCPLRFKFQYVDGHPGLTEGYGAGMAIGSLTHLALELDIDSVEGLRCESADSPESHLISALELADRFRRDAAFESIRSVECAREVAFVINVGSLTLRGIADLVGDDYVVDYKTDSEMDPEEHRFQLWAYANALKKPKAHIAYLRHGVLHEFGQEELLKIANEAQSLLDGILTGDYEPKPSEMKCNQCVYNKICDFRAVQN
jgi:ATP-dependent helicase/nuclease subunit A